MALVFCTLYHGDIHLHKVSRKYIKQFSSNRADTYIREITIFNVQMAITPVRLSRVEVLMFCTSSHDALYLCEFLSKYLKWFPTYKADTSTCRNCHFHYLLCSKDGNSKSRLTRARVLVFCTSSYSDLHLQEIS